MAKALQVAPAWSAEYARRLYDLLAADSNRIFSVKGIRSLEEWPAQREQILAELKAVFDG